MKEHIRNHFSMPIKWTPKVSAPILLALFLVSANLPLFASKSAFTQASSSQIRTVFVIVMENANWSQIKGNSNAPYINQTLLKQGAHAEQYFNPPGIHPSLPNYLWMEAGTNFGIKNDGAPPSNSQGTTNHLVTLLNKAGISWKAYEENIDGSTCPLQDGGIANLYAAKHDPFVYFNDVTQNQTFCTSHIRPYTELARDLTNNTAARYNFITPNLCDDMHDNCGQDPIHAGDTWLSQNLPQLLNSSIYKNNGAIFLTWDEAETGDGPIGMLALSPLAKAGYQNSIHYTHSSLLRTVEEIFGVTPLLGDAATATDLSDLFLPSAFSQLCSTPTATSTIPSTTTTPSSPTTAGTSPTSSGTNQDSIILPTSTPSPSPTPSAVSSCCPATGTPSAGNSTSVTPSVTATATPTGALASPGVPASPTTSPTPCASCPSPAQTASTLTPTPTGSLTPAAVATSSTTTPPLAICPTASPAPSGNQVRTSVERADKNEGRQAS